MSWPSPILKVPDARCLLACPAPWLGWWGGSCLPGPALLPQGAPIAPASQAAPGPSDLEGQGTMGKSISSTAGSKKTNKFWEELYD